MSLPAPDLAAATATDLLDGFRDGRFTPVDALDAVFAQLDRLEPQLNAFCLIDWDAAQESARGSAARWAKGEPQGFLDGVPVSVKDIILTKGWPTLRGSRTVNPDQPWDEDGPAVARLREHGAVLFGKTTTPEFAFKGVTDSPLTGTTRNPWNLALTPGGSSGGASASVAAGIGPLALATDAGGSIRIPSSFSGVFGHKPSGGRVAMYPPTPYASLAGFGPISRSVRDAALMMSCIAEPDARDWDADPRMPERFDRILGADPKSWRIAFSPTLGFVEVQPEVARIVEAAALRFASMGATVERVDHVMYDPWPILSRFKRGLTAYAFRNLPASRHAEMDPALVEEIQASRGAELEDHLDAQMKRAELGRVMAAFHQTYDLLLTPTTAALPFPIRRNAPDGYEGRAWYGFTFPFNLTRQPAASVPCGLSASGLPVGLQIVGPLGGDLAVLQAAHAYEEAHPWPKMAPMAGKDPTP